ncbi:MAG: response regulator [Rhodoferax sp.]|nr:response regulator [Rhodoferax sp.]
MAKSHHSLPNPRAPVVTPLTSRVVPKRPTSALVRVLLVDDSLPVRQRLRSLIDESGIGQVVAEAATIEQALTAFEDCVPDALVLDLQLHDGSGFTVLEQVKRRRPECRVVVVTNSATPEVRNQCRRMGADECLEKSNDFERLPRMLVGAAEAAADVGSVHGDGERANAIGAATQRRSPDVQFQLTDSLAAAIYTCDAEGRITYFNAAAVALWGREPVLDHDRWCGWWRLLDPQGHTIAPDQYPMAQAIRERRPLGACEILVERPDGSRRQVLAYPQPFFAADGTVTGAVNLLVDITPLRRLQTERQQQLALAQATLDSLDSQVCLIDSNGTILSVNRAWRQYGAANDGEASRTNEGANYLAVCAQGVRAGWPGAAEFADGLRGVLQGSLGSFEVEYPCDSPDIRLWFAARITRLAGYGPSSVTIAHTDITQRKQAEAARVLLERQLYESQKMEAVGTLASSIAHDFNNTMGAILGNVELARQDIAVDHPVAISLGQIQKAGLRARSLVQKILSFSRRQPQAMQVQLLRPLVEEGIDLLRATLPSGVTLHSAFCDEPLAACLDATQLHQVLMNLGTNAWHSMQGQPGSIEIGLAACDRRSPAMQGPPGSIEIGRATFDRRSPGLTVRPSPEPGASAGAWSRLWVRDSGCGMDETTLARIFEPFFTTKPDGIGTGLGLATVCGIVCAHGGEITVDSAPAQGSCFHIYLPVRALDDSSENSASSQPDAKPALATRANGQHVLYLDDDECMSMVVARLLPRVGFRVTCFQNAELALEALRSQPDRFDIVITDFNMPRQSGLDVAREVSRIHPGLPVVITSGDITEDLIAEAAEAGVRGMFNKARTVEDLGHLTLRALAVAGALV